MPRKRKHTRQAPLVGSKGLGNLYDYAPPEGFADLYDYARPNLRLPAKRPLSDNPRISVTDDWPEVVPITDAELRVIEAHFADILDEIFGSLP
jgi:hypothetical protein